MALSLLSSSTAGHAVQGAVEGVAGAVVSGFIEGLKSKAAGVGYAMATTVVSEVEARLKSIQEKRKNRDFKGIKSDVDTLEPLLRSVRSPLIDWNIAKDLIFRDYDGACRMFAATTVCDNTALDRVTKDYIAVLKEKRLCVADVIASEEELVSFGLEPKLLNKLVPIFEDFRKNLKKRSDEEAGQYFAFRRLLEDLDDSGTIGSLGFGKGDFDNYLFSLITFGFWTYVLNRCGTLANREVLRSVVNCFHPEALAYINIAGAILQEPADYKDPSNGSKVSFSKEILMVLDNLSKLNISLVDFVNKPRDDLPVTLPDGSPMPAESSLSFINTGYEKLKAELKSADNIEGLIAALNSGFHPLSIFLYMVLHSSSQMDGANKFAALDPSLAFIKHHESFKPFFTAVEENTEVLTTVQAQSEESKADEVAVKEVRHANSGEISETRSVLNTYSGENAQRLSDVQWRDYVASQVPRATSATGQGAESYPTPAFRSATKISESQNFPEHRHLPVSGSENSNTTQRNFMATREIDFADYRELEVLAARINQSPEYLMQRWGLTISDERRQLINEYRNAYKHFTKR